MTGCSSPAAHSIGADSWGASWFRTGSSIGFPSARLGEFVAGENVQDAQTISLDAEKPFLVRHANQIINAAYAELFFVEHGLVRSKHLFETAQSTRADEDWGVNSGERLGACERFRS